MARTFGLCFAFLSSWLFAATTSVSQQEEVKELPLEVVRTFKALPGEINWVAFSPDESVIALGSRNSDTVFLYDVETGKERTRIKLPHAPRDTFAFAFSANGKTLAWREAFPGSVVRIFDTSNGKLLRQFQFRRIGGMHDGSAFSSDGKLFAIATSDKSVELWNVATGKPVRVFAQDLPSACAFSPDGKLLASQDMYGQVRVWDVKGKLLRQLDRDAKPRAPSPITRLAFAPDSKRLAACGAFMDDWAILVWDVTSGKKLQQVEISPRGNGPPSALVFTPDSQWIGLSFRGGVSLDLTFWDVASGKKVGVVRSPAGRLGGGFVEKSVLFTRKGNYLAAGGMGAVRLYAPRKGQEQELQFLVPKQDAGNKSKN